MQILTKGDGSRDFDLLGENDWYGATITNCSCTCEFNEPQAIQPWERLEQLKKANKKGIKTWVSFEPVLYEDFTLKTIEFVSEYVDKVKIGKLNYYPSAIDWAKFGREVEDLCRSLGLDYYIKDSLRKEMEKNYA